MYDDVGRVLANEDAARGVARRVETDEVSRRDAIMMVSIIQFYGWVSCSLVAIASLTSNDAQFLFEQRSFQYVRCI